MFHMGIMNHKACIVHKFVWSMHAQASLGHNTGSIDNMTVHKEIIESHDSHPDFYTSFSQGNHYTSFFFLAELKSSNLKINISWASFKTQSISRLPTIQYRQNERKKKKRLVNWPKEIRSPVFFQPSISKGSMPWRCTFSTNISHSSRLLIASSHLSLPGVLWTIHK